jgi:cholestenol Delta-isomerase
MKSTSPEAIDAKVKASDKQIQGVSYNDLPSRLPILPAFDDDQQRQLYSYFVTNTSTVSCLYYRTDFWSYRILQLSLTEPAIKCAICSLSALHNMSRAANGRPTPSGRTAAEHRSYSLIQYNLAVKHTQNILAKSGDGDADAVTKGLVACVLFICVENLIGNFKTAQMHLQNGLKIIARQTTQRANQIQKTSIQVPEDIVQVLHRLDLQAMSLGDSRNPYPHHMNLMPLDINAMPRSFDRFDAATSHLIDIFRCIIRVASLSEPKPIPQSSLDAFTTLLSNWSISFNHLLSTSNIAKQTPNSVILMKMYHILLTILVSVRVYGLESRHDSQLNHYRYLVALGTTIITNEESRDASMFDDAIFSFEPGVIFALFFTAIKCRHPVVRRQAVDLLRRSRQREGAWESVGAAHVADFVIEVEEEGLTDTERTGAGPEVVKEGNRVHLVNIFPFTDQRAIDVGCLVRKNDVWGMKNRRIVY